MRFLHSFLLLLLTTLSCYTQNSVGEIIEQNIDQSYYHICDEIDNYFKEKHPNLSPMELTEGEHRDGQYVKYKRWQQFWKSRLERDGTLANLSYYKKKAEHHMHSIHKNNVILDNFEWTNISYTDMDQGLGRTNAIGFHPTDPKIFYVGAAIGGIWKTTDGGFTYVPLGDDLPFLAVSAIIVDQDNPNNIYIAISDRVWYGPPSIGIYKSEDAGQTWNETSLKFKFEDNTRVYWMEADPNNPDIMLVGTAKGLYRTSDAFETHDLVITGSVSDVKFMPFSSETVYCAINGVGSGFFKSTDGGKTFTRKKSAGSLNKRICVTPLDTNIVYYNLPSNNSLYKSFDAGENFESRVDVNQSGMDDGIMIISPQNKEHFITGYLYLAISNESDENFNLMPTWSSQANTNFIHVDQRNVFINPLQPELIYLCNDGGVYTVNVNTNEFVNLSKGLQITQYYDIAVTQNDVSMTAAGSQDNGNILFENGRWRRTAGGDGMNQAFDAVNEDLRYSAIQYGKIYRFDNNVQTHISRNIPDDSDGNGEWITPLRTHPTDANVLYTAYEKVYRSNDKGNTWETISPLLAGGYRMNFMEIAPSNPERIYAMENFGVRTSDLYPHNSSYDSTELYRKEVDTDSWTTIVLPTLSHVEDMAIHPDNMDHIFISCGSYIEGEKVYRSYDGGTTWENISGNLPNLPATAIAYYQDNEDYLFVGTDDGMYYTEADIIDWQRMGTFPNTYISEIEIHNEGRIIRVGTHGRGIFEGSLELDLVSTEDPLAQSDCITVYPNPVRDILNIDEVQNQSIDLIDIYGQLIMKIEQPNTNISHLNKGNYLLIKKEHKRTTPCVTRITKL